MVSDDTKLEYLLEKALASSKSVMYKEFMLSYHLIFTSIKVKKDTFPDADKKIEQAIRNSMIYTIRKMYNGKKVIDLLMFRERDREMYERVIRLYPAENRQDSFRRFLGEAGLEMDIAEPLKANLVSKEELLQAVNNLKEDGRINENDRKTLEHYFTNPDIARIFIGGKGDMPGSYVDVVPRRLGEAFDILQDTIKFTDYRLYKIVDKLIFRNLLKNHRFSNMAAGNGLELEYGESNVLERDYYREYNGGNVTINLGLDAGELRIKDQAVVMRSYFKDKMANKISLGLHKEGLMVAEDSEILLSDSLYLSTALYESLEKMLMGFGFRQVT